MTSIQQLYGLQELDLEISHQNGRIAEIATQLADRSELDDLETQLEAQTAPLQEARQEHRTCELDVEATRTKLTDSESKLYGGSVTNLRELEGLEKEATILRAQLEELDAKLLEMMVRLEESQEKVRSTQETISRVEEGWELEKSQLTAEQGELVKAVVAHEARRTQLTAQLGAEDLKLYEDLRQSKGGVAIAKVERGLCRGCRMALPTHQLQRARAGRETVRCNSCGRILFVS